MRRDIMKIYVIYDRCNLISSPLKVLSRIGEEIPPLEVHDELDECVVAIATNKKDLNTYLTTHTYSRICIKYVENLDRCSQLYELKPLDIITDDPEYPVLTILSNYFEKSMIDMYCHMIHNAAKTRLSMINYQLSNCESFINKKIIKSFYQLFPQPHEPNEFKVYVDLFRERLKL